MPRKKKFKTPPPVAYSDEPILTTAQLAQYYCCSIDSIKVNFNRNKDRFIEGKHYFKLEGDALKIFKDNLVTESYSVNFQISPHTPILYLWTKRGAARHAKILDADKAWDVFDLLEEFYFDHEKFLWNKAREESKAATKNFKDVMKDFAAYAKAQGTSRPPVAFYSYYFRLCNNLAGLPKSNGRDTATAKQLGLCAWFEDCLSEIFIGGMKKILLYKEIESCAKHWTANLFAAIKIPILIK